MLVHGICYTLQSSISLFPNNNSNNNSSNNNNNNNSSSNNNNNNNNSENDSFKSFRYEKWGKCGPVV